MIVIALVALLIIGFVLLATSGGDDEGAGDDADAAMAPAPLADAGAPSPLDGVDAAPARAALEVTVKPAEATIALDGRPPVAAPATFEDLAPGPHVVEVSRRRYRTEQETVELDAGERRALVFDLQRERQTRPARAGTLTVKTQPWSTVHLGDRELGTTPFADVSLPAGTHTLTFRNPKRKTVTKQVVIDAGKTTKLNFSLP